MTDNEEDMEEMEVDSSSDEGSSYSIVDQSFNGSGDESAYRTGIENTSAVGRVMKESGFEVSFFKINLQHIDLDHNHLNRNTTRANVKTIVEKYNKRAKIEKRKGFKPKDCTDRTFLFDVEVYVQTSEGKHKLLETYGIEESVCNYNIVIFFCNTDSVYAVTQRQGYRLIERYIDYKFPQNISRRLLSEEGMIKHKSVNLYGNARSSEEVLIKGRPTSLLSFQICIEFYARLRSDASIRKTVNCFGTKDIKVNIGLGKIRFLHRIGSSQYPHIISHLDRIDRGEMTFTISVRDKQLIRTRTVEKDSESFTNFVQKVLNDRHKDLNSDLTERIRQKLSFKRALSSGSDSEDMSLDNFYVCHKDYDDFSRGTDFQLVFKANKKCLKTFKRTPILSTILNQLKEWNQMYGIFTVNNKQSFAKQLNKVHLSFKNNDITIEDTLLNCIEGEMMADQYYWRRRRIWYCILGDSLRVIHNEFIKVLKKYLMKKNESGNLMSIKKAPNWFSNEPEKDYNCKFKQDHFKQHFLCMDGQLTNEKLELFDLMSYYKPKRFIYHIKRWFNREMRVACSQLRNSAETISSTVRLTNTDEQNLKDYYKKVKKEYEGHKNVPEFVNTFEKFKTILRDPALTFVLAIALKPSDNNSLNEEKKVKDVLKSTELKRLYAKHKIALIKSGIANDLNSFENKVINRLINENYLRRTCSDFEVTSKLLFCNGERKMSLRSFNVRQNEIIRDILSSYRSRYGTVGPMMDVIHLKKEIEGFGYTFKICEIIIE